MTVAGIGAMRFLTILARWAKWRVESVSAKQRSSGETVAITAVRASPPRASRSSIVSFESRYGTCVRLLDVPDSAEMTLPNAESDLLMEHASLSCLPLALESFCRSEPARSTRWSDVVRRLLTTPSAPSTPPPPPPSPPCSSAVTCRVKTAWEREDSTLELVAATTRLDDAVAISRVASARLAMGSCRSPSTCTRPPSPSRTRSDAQPRERQSVAFSW